MMPFHGANFPRKSERAGPRLGCEVTILPKSAVPSLLILVLGSSSVTFSSPLDVVTTSEEAGAG